MFRKNVAALIACDDKFLTCFRPDHKTWQSVQGGVEPMDESLEAALGRELNEELGIKPGHFQIIQKSRFWRRYSFLKNAKSKKREMGYLGQEQMWFFVKIGNFDDIDLKHTHKEFTKVKLVSIETLLDEYPVWKLAPCFDFCRELGLVK